MGVDLVAPNSTFCLENPMDRGAWWDTVHEVAKSQTRLSNFTSLQFHIQNLYFIQGTVTQTKGINCH